MICVAEPEIDSGNESTGPLSLFEQAANTAGAAFRGLLNFGSGDVKQLLANPSKYIFARITEYVLGVIFGLVFGVAALIEGLWNRVIAIIGFTGTGIIAPFATAGDLVLGGVGSFNQFVAQTVSDSLGIAGPFILIPLLVIEIALVVRAIPPLLVAGSDLLGSVPIIGSVLDAAATFAIEYLDVGEILGGTD